MGCVVMPSAFKYFNCNDIIFQRNTDRPRVFFSGVLFVRISSTNAIDAPFDLILLE